MAKPELKHLNYVTKAASAAYSSTAVAERLYAGAKAYVPASVQPYLSAIEDSATSKIAPVLKRAEETSEQTLHAIDGKVDLVLTSVSSAVETGKNTIQNSLSSLTEVHNDNMRTFSSATEKYFAYMVHISDWVADRLSPAKNVAAARDALKSAVATAQGMADTDKAVAYAQSAWASFVAVPAVQAVLSAAEPRIKDGLTAFHRLHDGLVVSPTFKRVVDTTSETLSWAQGTTPYKLAASYLYPYVKPVAEPTLINIQNSETLSSVITYWRPVAVV